MKGPTDAQLLKDVIKAPPVRISASQLRILAVIDRGPTYGRKLAEEHPRLFASGSVAHDGSLLLDSKRVYDSLKRLADRGFIEPIPHYRPPGSPARQAYRGHAKAKWYRLTRQGREVLADNRQTLTKV